MSAERSAPNARFPPPAASLPPHSTGLPRPLQVQVIDRSHRNAWMTYSREVDACVEAQGCPNVIRILDHFTGRACRRRGSSGGVDAEQVCRSRPVSQRHTWMS